VLVKVIAVNQMDPYDSDSSDGGPEFPSQSTIPEPPPFNDPNYETYKHGQQFLNDPNYETYKHGQQFLIVDHTANQRNGSEISRIWQHGGERRRVDDGSMDRYWRCGHCNNKRILKCPKTGRGATSYPIRHLKNRHFIDLTADHQALPLQPTSFFGTVAGAAASAAASAVTQTAGKLISTMNMDRFRYLLIRWIVIMNIALVCVKAPCFRELLLYYHSGLEPYLVKSTDTIRSWIMKEFERQKLEIKKELADARSRIHISSNLWTSPNSLPLVGIVAHYLDKNLVNKATLIGLRRVKGSHTGENIAEVMIPVLKEMGIVSRLGYFIGDNASPNDTYWRVICRKLRPDIKEPDSRRVRYLGHILNLAAKAFLFGKDADAFEEDINSKRSNAHIEKLRELWRKKGPIRKFHNLILHIRVTPQRREEFLGLLKGIIEKDLEGELNAVYSVCIKS
jgi:hypothetical protein